MRSLTIALLVAASLAAARQNAGIRRMDIEARHHGILAERVNIGDIINPGNTDNSSSTVSQSASVSQDNGNGNGNSNGNGNGNGSQSTTTVPYGNGPSQNLPTTTTTDPPTSTSTPNTPTSTPSSTTTPTSTSTSQAAQNSVNIISRTTTDTYRGTTLYANSGNLSNLRASQTGSTSTDAAASSTSTDSTFLHNKTAVAATFTILGIVAAGSLVFVGFWFYRKSKRGAMIEEDTWDEASMKEYTHGAGASISAPSAAVLADDGYGAAGGLGRKKTLLPSQSAGAAPLARTRSGNSPPRRDVIDPDEEPDEILQLPPVANYDRPRDSAYDIVPAAPPPAAYVSQGGGYGYNAYASGSNSPAGGLQPPKRAGDHTSFGSGFGSDPFAGTGFVDATRESTYGPGQAGRGAGYHGGQDNQAPVGMGNQWPQGYNQAYGYSGGNHSPYGGGAGYGYAQ